MAWLLGCGILEGEESLVIVLTQPILVPQEGVGIGKVRTHLHDTDNTDTNLYDMANTNTHLKTQLT